MGIIDPKSENRKNLLVFVIILESGYLPPILFGGLFL